MMNPFHIFAIRISLSSLFLFPCLLMAAELVEITSPNSIIWSGNVAYEKAVIRVGHPNGMVTDHALVNGLSLSLDELANGALQNTGRDEIDHTMLEDGLYQYEVRFLPAALKTRGVDESFEGSVPEVQASSSFNGSFRLEHGYILSAVNIEE